jgi:hypothetical protein
MTLFSAARPVAFRKTEENGTDGTFPVYPAKKSPPLSIFPQRDDYRMKDPARKVVLLAPTLRRRPLKERV